MVAISVIINCHNSNEFLGEAIASALAQTAAELEVLIWDNASSQRAEMIAASFRDDRIRYVYTEQKVALYQARCDAIQASRGDCVAFLDSDDLWAPNKLSLQLDSMEATDAVASCSDYVIFSQGAALEDTYFQAYSRDVVSLGDVLLPYAVGMSSLVARTDVLKSVLPDPPPSWFMIEDLDIVFRLLTRGTMSVVNEPLMRYRVHGSNASRDRGAYVREVEEWLADLPSRRLESSLVTSIDRYYRTQALRALISQNLQRGQRRDALEAWRRMPWSPTKLKWALGLVGPRRLTRDRI